MDGTGKERVNLRLKQSLYIIRNNKGLSLLEVLISIFILSIMAAPFLSLFVHATKTNLETKQMVDATFIAQGCMEEIYSLSTKSNTGDFDVTRGELVTLGYSETITGSEYVYKKIIDNLYVKSRIDINAYTPVSTNVFKVIVEVYYDEAYQKLASKMENVVVWD